MPRQATSVPKRGKSCTAKYRSRIKIYSSYLDINPDDPFFQNFSTDSSSDEQEASAGRIKRQKRKDYSENPDAVADAGSDSSDDHTPSLSVSEQNDRLSIDPLHSGEASTDGIVARRNRIPLEWTDSTASTSGTWVKTDTIIKEDSGNCYDDSDTEEEEDVYDKCITDELGHIPDDRSNDSNDLNSDEASMGFIGSRRGEQAIDTSDESAEESEYDTSSDAKSNEVDINNDRTSDSISENDNVETDNFSSRRVFTSRMSPLTIPLMLKPNVTAKDHLLAVIAICMRYNSSYEMMITMLKWTASTVEHSKLPKSKNALWSILCRDDSAAKRHLYCSECRDGIGEGSVVQQECSCGACGPQKRNKNMSYFVEVSLQIQLEELFATPGIANELNYRFTRQKNNPDAIEDIYDAQRYRELCQPGEFLCNPLNFSFSFGSDGASIADSSDTSAWPIYVQINEFHPHARKKNIMLAGIWVDKKHPVPNTFVYPFVKEANKLFKEGITWKPNGANIVTSKFIPLIFCADSGARWEFLGMTQFNGRFGCTFCYASGVFVPGSRQAKYPVEANDRLRSDDEIRYQAREAFTTNIKVCGIKGPSTLSLLPNFSMSFGPVVDSMHSVYQGAYRQHTLLLLECYGEPFYIGSPNNIALIDQRLMSIKLPSRIARKPRSLKFVNMFTATEWRNWGYYGLLCLDGILPNKYLKHMALLFEAAYLLNGNSLTLFDLERAEKLLANYITDFQKYFGIHRMTYNIYLLGHLCTTVRNWGPFWVHSAFAFESMNRKIIRSITSSNGMAWQVYTRFLMVKFIKNAAYDPSISNETKLFIASVLNVRRNDYDVDPQEDANRTFRGIGKGRQRSPSRQEVNEIERAGYQCTRLRVFQKAKINGIEYRCYNFKPQTKFMNSIIYCSTVGFAEIVDIVDWELNNVHIHGIFVYPMRHNGFALGTTFIKKVSDRGNLVFVPTQNVPIYPAFKVDTPRGLHMITLPNVWETD